MGLATGILIVTALWHGAGAWHFLLFPERTLLRTTRERPANLFATELFRFLGGLNAALALFALLCIALPAGSVWIALAGFSAANLSQFALDLRVLRKGLAHGPMFRMILWGDGAVFLLGGLAAILSLPA